MNTTARAFTLIELLIVVAIIAILAAIAVPNFLEAQTRSKVSRAHADLRSVATAMEAYAVDANKYLPFARTVCLTKPADCKLGEPQVYLLTTPVAYMTSIPRDVFQAGFPKNYPPARASKNYQAFFGPVPRFFAYNEYTFPINGSVGWTFRCMGADTDWDLVGDPLDNEAAPQDGIYDATNGTISNGDVLRSGGGIDFVNNQ